MSKLGTEVAKRILKESYHFTDAEAFIKWATSFREYFEGEGGLNEDEHSKISEMNVAIYKCLLTK